MVGPLACSTLHSRTRTCTQKASIRVRRLPLLVMVQVYEGATLSALLVDGAPGCGGLRLTEVHLLTELGDQPLLELHTARLMYVVQNAGTSGRGGGGGDFGSAVRVVLRSEPGAEALGPDPQPDCGMTAALGERSSADSDWARGSSGGLPSVRWLSPEQEAGACRWVLHLCHEELRTAEALEEQGSRGDECDDAASLSAAESWMRATHIRLASTYCEQRAALLRTVMRDLEAQLLLLQGC